MICLDCESTLDLTAQEHCSNCGGVPDRALCGLCDRDYEIDVFALHLCRPLENPEATNARTFPSSSYSTVELEEDDYSLLLLYFELQDQNRLVNQDKSETLGNLFLKFGENDLLTHEGQLVGKIIKTEYLGLDVELLKQKFPEVYRACLTKVKQQKYIKRATNLI